MTRRSFLNKFASGLPALAILPLLTHKRYSKIIKAGTVVDGVAYGWHISGENWTGGAIAIFQDGTTYFGGYTVEQLAEIAERHA